MPLVRVEVRNEYGLGLPELYKEANRDDPKAVLDGVAVAGLVGILRQLGDLAEFAAEVFHGLQEQVMITSSRSHKLMVHVQNIEAALPPLEKAILAQRSHLHFAYTTGSHWHARIRSEQNHFIYSDLPRFIMDSYEECRDPPRLHLLDKFDTGGPGSCLKRYSDPTFFKRASAGSNEANVEKVPRDKKAHRRKKKRPSLRNGEVSHGAPKSDHSDRMQFVTVNVDAQTSPSQTVSTFDVALGDQSNSFDSRTGSGYIECIFRPSYGSQSEEPEPKEFSSSRLKIHRSDALDSSSLDEQSEVVDDDIRNSLSQEQTGRSSSCVTWDEKTEIMEPTGQQYDLDEFTEMLPTNFDLDTQDGGAVNHRTVDQTDFHCDNENMEEGAVNHRTVDQMDFHCDNENMEEGAVSHRTVDQTDFHIDNENMPTLVSSGNQLDDIESETDNYMDALNTIESESETDLDCQTKREVEKYFTLTNKEIEDEKQGLTALHSDSHPSIVGSDVPVYISSNNDISGHNPNSVSPDSDMAAHRSSNNGTSGDKPNSVSSECYTQVQSPQMVGKSFAPGSFPDIDLCAGVDILDGSNLETVVSEVSSSGSSEPNSHASMDNKIISSPCQSQKSPSVPSGIHSVMFWTNGGLLGLEPSKPPDFSVLNAVSQDSEAKSKDGTIQPSSQSNILKGDGHPIKSHIVVKSSEIIEHGSSSKCSTPCHNGQKDGSSITKTSGRFSPADLDTKLEQLSDFHQSNSINHAHRHGFDENNTRTPETEWPVSPNAQATKAIKEDGKNSSRVFEFSNRLLVNGFRRQVSLVGDDIRVSSVKSGVSEPKSTHQAYKTFSGRTFKEQFGSGSPIMSPSSSPPLEHMKISFQPIDGFETAKLKLKFPEGSNCFESSGDMFPSFQLVPEPAISLHDIGSDSDDDTFCRSSSYMSDDCLSNHSDSNSEQWENGDSPRSKDHELYDALCRISSTESVSSSLEIGGTAQGGIPLNCGLQSPFTEDSVEPSQSGRFLDLPSFDTLDPSLRQELVNDSDAKYLQESHFPKEPTPPPPPLPPLQWRGMKPHPDMAAGKLETLSEALTYAFDWNFSAPTISQQPKPAPVKQDQFIEAIPYTPKSKQPDWQMLNGQREANKTSNGKVMDEKEDFLHQIRTKSFNLRHTASGQPTFAPGAPNNVKVTAILEKANAIRQAVGSDYGDDDDNWSDH